MAIIVLIGKSADGETTIKQNFVLPYGGDAGQTVINVEGQQFQGWSLHAAFQKARRAGKISHRRCSKKSPCFECRIYEANPGCLCPAAKKHWNRMHAGNEYHGSDRILEGVRKRREK